MKIKKKNINKLIFSILIALYTFLPQNYYIVGSVSVINFIALSLIVWYILTFKKIKLINFQKNNFLFWIFIIIQVVMFLTTAGIVSGIANFITYFIVCYLFVNIATDEDMLLSVIDMIILSGFILGLIGILEALTRTYIFQSSLFNIEESIRYGVLRATTTFGHPINLGLYQGIVAILAFYRLNINHKRKNRKYYIAAYIIALISMILTVSRLAICFYLIAQSIILIQLGVDRFLRYVCIASILSILVIFTFSYIGFDISKLVNDFTNSVLSILGFSSEVSSNTIGFGNRLDLYKWVIEDVRGNNLFGLGIEAKFSYKMYEWFTKTSIEVHYLNTYFKTGLVGLITLLLSYFGNLYFMNRDRKKRYMDFEKKIPLTGVLIAIFISYYIAMFGVQETDTLRIYNILVCLGICYVRIRKSRRVDYKIIHNY